MNAFGVIFFSVCFVSLWLSFWAIAEMCWVRRERRRLHRRRRLRRLRSGGFGFICRRRVIERKMLYEFYIKLLATNVELAHK